MDIEKLSALIAGEVKQAERDLWKIPETGYREWKTTAYIEEKFEKMGYSLTKAGDVPGFYTVIDTGRQGPTFLILAELDSLICTTHPEADKKTGAVHACGHHAQCAAMIGVAKALKQPSVTGGLSGRIKLCLVPAEEGIEIGYRAGLMREGKIKFIDGKGEFISRGYFDDCDLAMMIHFASKDRDNGKFYITDGCNGLIRKIIKFTGVSSHAGGSPHEGVNALYAANLALSSINALRETFRDEDKIRVHPIITQGGSAVNAIPDEIVLESYVRGASAAAIKKENDKINRAIAGCAAAMGAKAHVQDFAGSLPLSSNKMLKDIAVSAAEDVVGKENIDYSKYGEWKASSTDMGDISSVMPAVHPYAVGAKGISHGNDYYIDDAQSCVDSALIQVRAAQLLLKDGAAAAKEIVKNAKPVFPAFKDYIAYKESLTRELELVAYKENGNIELKIF